MFKDRGLLAYLAYGFGLIAMVVWADQSGYVPFSSSADDAADRSANQFHK